MSCSQTHITLLLAYIRLFTLSGDKFVGRFSSRRSSTLNTRSLAAEDAGIPRIEADQ